MPNRLQVLQFLKDSARRIREIATANPSKVTADLLRIADEIEADAANLEAELIEAGVIPKPPANQN